VTGIFFDTNLLLYLVDQNEPKKQAQAARVLDHLELQHLGRLGAQNLAEFISVSIRKLRPPLTAAQALDQARLFTSMWPVFDTTSQIVLEATRGVRDYSLSYYNAQIWAAARLNQVPVVFSEDFQDGMILEGVKFVDPFAPQFEIDQWV
jgi:predicted nucleic acid-binding protein